MEQKSFEKLPKHIAIICDGNGRWAAERGLPRSLGHKKGSEPIKPITKSCHDLGIKVLSLYVFSTENWSRSKKEVDFLMKLFEEFFIRLREERITGVRIRHIGIKANLSEKLLKEIQKTEELTKNETDMTLNIALNYGGRSEIINSVQSLLSEVKTGNLDIDDIDDTTINNHLFTHDLPDVDLIIRTSNEYRISNFLLWQSSKAQLWVTQDFWPDFTVDHLYKALEEFI